MSRRAPATPFMARRRHGATYATDTDRRLFIADPGNQRIASVKLGYHAEEKVALNGK